MTAADVATRMRARIDELNLWLDDGRYEGPEEERAWRMERAVLEDWVARIERMGQVKPLGGGLKMRVNVMRQEPPRGG